MPNEPVVVFYRPEAELFFVRLEVDDSYTWFGPVDGSPLEALDLEPLLLESMKEFGPAGNARIALGRMIRSKNRRLATISLRLIHQVLTDEATLKSIDDRTLAFHQADLNLDWVIELLNESGEELRESGVSGVAEVEAAVKSMEARFDRSMPEMAVEDYNEAGYLQQDLPGDDLIQWAPERDGMQLGFRTPGPVSLKAGSEPHHLTLYLRNSGDHTVRFHLEGHMAEQVRVDAADSNGQSVRTEFADIPTSIPGFPLAWRLEPGEKLELCTSRLTWAPPDASVEATGIRSMRVATTRLRTTPGRHRVAFSVRINGRRVVRGKGEWFGTLTSNALPIIIHDDDTGQNAN